MGRSPPPPLQHRSGIRLQPEQFVGDPCTERAVGEEGMIAVPVDLSNTLHPPTITSHYIIYIPTSPMTKPRLTRSPNQLVVLRPTRRTACCLNTSLAIRSLSGRDHPTTHMHVFEITATLLVGGGERSIPPSPSPSN